jgi:hypothetical protein
MAGSSADYAQFVEHRTEAIALMLDRAVAQ